MGTSGFFFIGSVIIYFVFLLGFVWWSRRNKAEKSYKRSEPKNLYGPHAHNLYASEQIRRSRVYSRSSDSENLFPTDKSA